MVRNPSKLCFYLWSDNFSDFPGPSPVGFPPFSPSGRVRMTFGPKNFSIGFCPFCWISWDLVPDQKVAKVNFSFEPCLSCWEHWRQRLRFQYAALSDFFRNFSIFFDFGWRFFLFSSSVLIHINTRIHIIWWDFWAPCERVMINGPITAEKRGSLCPRLSRFLAAVIPLHTQSLTVNEKNVEIGPTTLHKQ